MSNLFARLRMAGRNTVWATLSAAQVTLSFIEVQQLPNLAVESRIDPGQALCQILVHR